MKLSLSYYITITVLKLKGIKKIFSQNPIDVQKIRKEDVLKPNSNFFKRQHVRRFLIEKTTITEIKTNNSKQPLVLFIHGGAFISGPAKHHWTSIKAISKETNCTIWMCDYPKAPEHTIKEISKNIDEIYKEATKQYHPNEIIIIGDSVGGTLTTTLTQRLIQKNIQLPRKIILICPVMDATMQNSEIDTIDKKDPMLSKIGVLSAKKMCAGEEELSNPIISPLYGDFKDFPKTIIYAASNDIMYPDQLLAINKMKKSKIDLEVITGENMPHIWPLLPVMKEARSALTSIIEHIRE